jgi:hypothetical protein
MSSPAKKTVSTLVFTAIATSSTGLGDLSAHRMLLMLVLSVNSI